MRVLAPIGTIGSPFLKSLFNPDRARSRNETTTTNRLRSRWIELNRLFRNAVLTFDEGPDTTDMSDFQMALNKSEVALLMRIGLMPIQATLDMGVLSLFR